MQKSNFFRVLLDFRLKHSQFWRLVMLESWNLACQNEQILSYELDTNCLWVFGRYIIISCRYLPFNHSWNILDIGFILPFNLFDA